MVLKETGHGSDFYFGSSFQTQIKKTSADESLYIPIIFMSLWDPQSLLRRTCGITAGKRWWERPRPKKPRAHWIQRSLIGKTAEKGAKPGGGFVLAHLILHKSTLNNVFMLQWSPSYHLCVIPANLFHLSPGSVPHSQKFESFFYFFLSSCSILLCSECKSFMDPLWSFHSDCKGASESEFSGDKDARNWWK